MSRNITIASKILTLHIMGYVIKTKLKNRIDIPKVSENINFIVVIFVVSPQFHLKSKLQFVFHLSKQYSSHESREWLLHHVILEY